MKRIIAFLLTMLMLLSLAACSRDFGEKRDIQNLETEETAEPSDDSGDDEDEDSDNEKPGKSSSGSKKEPVEPSEKEEYEYEYEYEYDDTAFQYIYCDNCRWIDTNGTWLDEYYDVYYVCGNCGYGGWDCPDWCEGCGAYFNDWSWEDAYYTYVVDANDGETVLYTTDEPW